MKITDPEVIRNGEKDLIEAVKEDLDMDAVKDIIKNRLTAKSLSSRGGQIVVHDNQVAFRLDFDVQLSGSLLFDRDGNHIRSDQDETDPDLPSDQADADLESLDLEDPGDSPKESSHEDSLQELDADDEEMRIDLPEYGLEDEADPPDPALEDDTPSLEDDPMESTSEDPARDTDLEGVDLEDDIIDEDINGILKENQDFWEQKKGS